jgi:hypothetical protein
MADKIKLQMALKDEKVNIYSLTRGGFNGKFSHQIMLCKKSDQIDDWKTKEPLLLTPKWLKPDFIYSEQGYKCEKAFENEFGEKPSGFPLKYVAYIKEIFKIKTTGVPVEICKEKNGVFNIWDPAGGPGKYWGSDPTGLIVLFRVYKVFTPGDIDHKVLYEAGSDKWKYRILGPLRSVLTVHKEEPILNDREFKEIRDAVRSILSSKSALIESTVV